MIKSDGVRYCDICDVKIPLGETYEACRLPKEAAEMFWKIAGNNPDILPNWIPDENGSIRMDICLQCVVSMKAGGNL